MNLTMRRLTMAAVPLAAIATMVVLGAQGSGPQPSCKMCPGTYVPNEEIQAYVKRAIDPENRFNPAKLFPTPVTCGEIRRVPPQIPAGLWI